MTLSLLIAAACFLFLKRDAPQKNDVSSSEIAWEPRHGTSDSEQSDAAENAQELAKRDGDAVVTEDMNSRAAIEKKMGREFTKEEIELKPPSLPWHAWGYSIETHGNSVRNNGIVRFYGKVVSEKSEPLEGVSLTAEISWAEPSFAKVFATGKKSHAKEIPVTTDVKGRFKIEDIAGRDLTLTNFTKEGYEIAGKKKYWGYSFNPQLRTSHRADPSSPVIFTMRKIGP